MPALVEGNVYMCMVDFASLVSMHVDDPRLQKENLDNVRMFWLADGCYVDVADLVTAFGPSTVIDPCRYVFYRGWWVPCVNEKRIAEIWNAVIL